MKTDTQEGSLYKLLSSNRRKRVSVLQLQKVSRSMSVATVLSNLRRRYNLTIENKEVCQKNRIIYSYYKLSRWSVKIVEKI